MQADECSKLALVKFVWGQKVQGIAMRHANP